MDLERFVTAQDDRGAYAEALAELRAGTKHGHWMWFVFPQLRGLGRSHRASYYGIASVAEARAYLAHPVLGPRLRECCRALLDLPGRSVEQVLGEIDAMKLRSSTTLFEIADPQQPLFGALLDRFYDGTRDPATLDVLGRG